MSKAKKFTISLIISIVLFIGIVFVEKTVVKYTPMVNVIYCIKDVDRKKPLTAANFTMMEIPLTSVNKDTIMSMSGISNMYAKENIYSGEVLNKKRIGTKYEVEAFNLEPGERAVSISFKNIEDCVGGTLRKDDLVDVMFTNVVTSVSPTVTTQTKFQSVRILDAIDAAGRRIDKTDTTIPVTTLIIAATPVIDGVIVNLKQSQGTITVLKVPEDKKQYNNITVKNGVVIQN